MKGKEIVSIVICVLATALSGCSVITANNRELLAERTQLSAGNVNEALAAVDPKKRDDLCAILDRAVLYSAQGRPEPSNAEFDRAITQIKQYENRAVVSATGAAAGGGSLLLNDKVLEYQGEGFEKVLIHALKARNYLMLGKEEDARVEIRNANDRQTAERKRNQAVIDEAKKQGNDKKVNISAMSPEIDRQFASSAAVLSRLDNVYQNPFATYLSSVVYELNDEPGDAFVDLKNAYEMTPNPLVTADLMRLASKLHRQDELPSGVTPAAKGVPTSPGNTLVMIDNGFAPERVEIKFPIPEPDGVLFAAVPITRPVPTNLSDVEVVNGNGDVIGKTEMMVDVEAMSVRNLRDHYPAILVRQAIRLGIKAAATHEVKNQAGVGGEILMSVFNAVTEQADLRGWYALPRSIHVARVNLPPGEQAVKLRLLDLSGQAFREVTVPVINAGSHLNIVAARYVNGQVLTSPPSATNVAQQNGDQK